MIQAVVQKAPDPLTGALVVADLEAKGQQATSNGIRPTFILICVAIC